ncbi:MAG: type II toxin-antitoxin system prevent-host-death family antitoxin, partial [Actinobacteria bacterium]|nr:type II toxin-antitoxin system prevent-host-death family antitoxin [Actinomycetota bacterium]
MCYSSKMTEVPSRELRNNTRDLIMRANKGETIVITVDGIPMAELQPV